MRIASISRGLSALIAIGAWLCFAPGALAQSNITRNGNNVTVTCDGNFTPLQTLCQNGNACNAIASQNLINPPAAGNSGQDNVSFSPVPATVEWKVTNVDLTVNTGGNGPPGPPPSFQNNADPALVSISNDPGGSFELEEADGTVTRGPIATAANPVHIQISRNVTQKNGNAQGDFALVQYQVKCTAVPPGTDSLTLDKTATPNTFQKVGDIITYNYQVTNTGTTTINNITVTDDRLGNIACPATSLPPGPGPNSTMTCTVQHAITQAELDQCTITNLGTASGTGTGPISDTDTETVTGQQCGGKTRTQTLIRDFLNRRVDLLASNEPDRPRLMRRFNAAPTATGGPTESMTIVGSTDSGQYSFGTSLGQMRAAAAQKKYDEAQKMSLGANSGPGYTAPAYAQTSAVDVWMEGHFQQFDDELGGADQDGNFGILYVGADYLVSRSVLIGVLVQFDWMDQQTQSLNADVRGRGWLAGPYASFQLSPNLYFDARGAWGESDNDISPFGTYTDSFDTERWLAKANLTGNWNLGSVYVSPSVGVIYVDEKSESYTDSLGNSIFSQSVRLGRLTFGPEFRYPIRTKDGAILEPHVSVTGMWDFDKDDTAVANVGGLLVSDQDFRVKTEAGLLVHTPDISDASFRATVSYDGIGDDEFSAWGGQLWVNWPLN